MAVLSGIRKANVYRRGSDMNTDNEKDDDSLDGDIKFVSRICELDKRARDPRANWKLS